MVWQDLINRLTRKQSDRRRSPRSTRRRLSVQTLAKRELLASDLAAISGVAFIDTNGNGTLNGAEAPLEGVQVDLYRDANTNGVYDAGTDNLIGSLPATGVDGAYRFTNLDGDDDDGDPLVEPTKTDTGVYFLVYSDAPGGPDLSAQILPDPIQVVVAGDTGVTQQVVDGFTTEQPGQPITQAAVGTNDDSSGDLGPGSGVLGDERDVQIDVLANGDPVTEDASFNVSIANSQLALNTDSSVQASLLVQYDGIDADGGAITLDPVGLRAGGATGVDLTNGDDSAGMLLAIRGDDVIAGGLIVRVYTDAGNFGTATIDIPDNLGDPDPQMVFLDLRSVGDGGDFTFTGTPDFTDVGAIELETDSALVTTGLDLRVNILRTEVANENTVNAAVIEPMTVGGEIFLDNGGGTDAADQNNGLRDAGEPDFPAQPGNEIAVELYALTDLNDTVDPADTPVATTTVTGGATSGAFVFTQLDSTDPIPPGFYAIVIPENQFDTGEPLNGYNVSALPVGYTNADGVTAADDANNDGSYLAGVGVVSGAFALEIGGEPDVAIDNTDTDDNRTIDFGVVPTVDVRVTKVVSAAPASNLTNDGTGTANFDLIIENLGPLDASNIVVTDFIPAGLTFVRVEDPADAIVATTSGVEAGGLGRDTESFTIANLAAGASLTYQLFTSIDTDIAADPQNEVQVAAFEVEDNDADDVPDAAGSDSVAALANNTATATADVPLATLSVTKSDSLTEANAGEQATYTITVANVSDDDAFNVTALDTLPTGTTFVSAAFTSGAGTVDETNGGANDGNVLITFGDLAGDADPANRESETVTITVLIDANLPDGDSPVVNTVAAQADNAAEVIDNDSTDVVRLTDVTVEKSVVATRTPDDRTDGDPSDDIIDAAAPFQPVAGGFVTYEVRAINAGPSTARGVTITDTLDAGLTFVPGSFDALGSGVTVAQVGQTLTFTVPDLATDQAGTADDVLFRFEVAIGSDQDAVIPNTATIATTDPESDGTNNTATANIDPEPQIDLALDKAVAPGTAVPGDGATVTYTFTVTHDVDSLSDASNVTVTDTLPAGLNGVTINDINGDITTSNFDAATRQLTVDYASIPVGETRTFTVTATVDAAATGTLTNAASVAVAGVTELDTTNNSDTASITLTPQFDLEVAKSVQGTTDVGPGDTVTFQIVVSHDNADDGTEADNGQSPSRATGVIVTDTLPAGVTFVSATSGGVGVTPTSTAGGVIVFPAFSLDPGATTRTLTVTATVDATATAISTLTNTASLTADAGETDTTAASNTDTADVTVTPEADLTVTKTVNRALAPTGTQLSYTVTVTNNGVSPAAAATAVDTLPAGVTFDSGTGPGGAALAAVGQTVTVNGGELAAGGSFQFTILATINDSVTADQVNSVAVSTTTPETSTANNTASTTTAIDQAINEIAGTIFLDSNRNGVQDNGETGVAGIQVQLSGGPLAAPIVQTTDANGDYLFDELEAGTYTIQRLGLPDETADGLETAGTGATPAESGDDIESVTVGGGTTEQLGNLFAVEPVISKRRFLSSFNNLN